MNNGRKSNIQTNINVLQCTVNYLRMFETNLDFAESKFYLTCKCQSHLQCLCVACLLVCSVSSSLQLNLVKTSSIKRQHLNDFCLWLLLFALSCCWMRHGFITPNDICPASDMIVINEPFSLMTCFTWNVFNTCVHQRTNTVTVFELIQEIISVFNNCIWHRRFLYTVCSPEATQFLYYLI